MATPFGQVQVGAKILAPFGVVPAKSSLSEMMSKVWKSGETESSPSSAISVTGEYPKPVASCQTKSDRTFIARRRSIREKLENRSGNAGAVQRGLVQSSLSWAVRENLKPLTSLPGHLESMHGRSTSKKVESGNDHYSA
jgi:hypothetical protein